MGICSKIKRDLLLDIHGALDEQDRSDLEAHLRVCRDCRDEKKRLLKLLGEIRELSEVPELSAAQTEPMMACVRERLRAEPSTASKRFFSGVPSRLIPIAAAACLVIFVTLLAYRTWTPQNDISLPGHQEQHLTQQDMEIIRHLDLLRNMDAIQKLVHIVDENGRSIPGDDLDMDVQGMRHNHPGVPYA